MLIVTGLVLTWRWFAFSNTAYLLMAALVYLHTIGGHFTFERVPFGWFTDFFGFERNHYDRIAHFTVGFYAYPLAEWLLRRRLVLSRTVLFLFPICFILAVAGVYEILEWLYAISADPEAGIAVIGLPGRYLGCPEGHAGRWFGGDRGRHPLRPFQSPGDKVPARPPGPARGGIKKPALAGPADHFVGLRFQALQALPSPFIRSTRLPCYWVQAS